MRLKMFLIRIIIIVMQRESIVGFGRLHRRPADTHAEIESIERELVVVVAAQLKSLQNLLNFFLKNPIRPS